MHSILIFAFEDLLFIYPIQLPIFIDCRDLSRLGISPLLISLLGNVLWINQNEKINALICHQRYSFLYETSD
jgi:hypothetical protein